MFTDAQCTTPIDVVYVDPPTCGAAPTLATTTDHRVFPIGDLELQPLFTRSSNAFACVPAPPIAGKQPHLLGDELELGTVTEAVLR